MENKTIFTLKWICLFAMSFHWAAILSFVLFVSKRKKLKKKKILWRGLKNNSRSSQPTKRVCLSWLEFSHFGSKRQKQWSTSSRGSICETTHRSSSFVDVFFSSKCQPIKSSRADFSFHFMAMAWEISSPEGFLPMFAWVLSHLSCVRPFAIHGL